MKKLVNKERKKRNGKIKTIINSQTKKTAYFLLLRGKEKRKVQLKLQD